ncbi:plasmid partitioning protein RepB [Neorhizobium galegae]|uniref:plasmid partitioning protein RepB n=1 Tax=Neorhizobium galegae TaxID=399 RepID=UPI001F219BC1|nr:plasmid partitioning protein RepB [Neorhizobium galegae]UIK08989.1 plasmid partitioning protein RepB [Neorhizobium galegae]
MSRRDTLKAALTRREQELPPSNSVVESPENNDAAPPPAPEKKLQHIRSGAVGAMSRTLGNIATAADQAKALIAAGSAVVEIPTDKLDGSFVSDRLPDDGEDYQRLADAIRETGQKSPILVRPNPSNPDRYQIAFGHRRVRVLASLGRPVKAVVQNLTDEELVVIQGQENSARADLSYIERGLFALALEKRGFDRQLIMTALGIEKTQLSRLMSLTHSLPRPLIEAIGPAPKAGRPRWLGLSERLAETKRKDVLNALLESREFKDADTDTRFAKVMTVLSAKSTKKRPEPIKAPNGAKLALLERGTGKVNLVFDEQATPAFADYVAAQLNQLHEEFLKSRRDDQS